MPNNVIPPQRVWTEIDRLTVEVRGLENKIGQLPTASAIAESVKPYLRGDVEAAWALQKAELPNLIREALQKHEEERVRIKIMELEAAGLEIGPDGMPRKKGGDLRSWLKANWLVIALFSGFMVYQNPDTVWAAARFLLAIF